MTTAPKLTSFSRVCLLRYVTTHPPASYLPKSHLMLRLHMRSEQFHNTHRNTEYLCCHVCFKLVFRVQITFDVIFWVMNLFRWTVPPLLKQFGKKKREIYPSCFNSYFFHTQKTQWKQALESRRNNRKPREWNGRQVKGPPPLHSALTVAGRRGKTRRRTKGSRSGDDG